MDAFFIVPRSSVVIGEISVAETATEAATAVIDISSSIASANAAAIDGAFLSIGLVLYDKERFMRPPLQFLAVLSDGRFMTPPSQSKYLLRSFPLDGTKLKGFQSPKVDKLFITRMVFPEDGTKIKGFQNPEVDKLFVARMALQVFKAQRLPKDGKAPKDVHRSRDCSGPHWAADVSLKDG